MKVRAIEAIPGADAIELAVVADYRTVVRKGQFKVGSLAVYLPEAAILPDGLIEYLGLTGKLSGEKTNRISAVKLRGCLSQGILYDRVPANSKEGDCVAQILGIIKHEPVIPEHMLGELTALFDHRMKFDIEDIKAYPHAFMDGEEVEFTEKTHGIFTGIAVVPGLNHPNMVAGDGLVYSKGFGHQGLMFNDCEENADNIYMQVAKNIGLHQSIRRAFPNKIVHVLGESYGPGVQDLHYGAKTPKFAAFDVWINGEFLGRDALAEAIEKLKVARVPVLYRGPFSKKVMHEHTNGKTIVGNGSHLREGLVVTPAFERSDNSLGRVILKSVSADYLTRKSKNATEFS
jgi:RNA ligase (TIGR02306 family)